MRKKYFIIISAFILLGFKNQSEENKIGKPLFTEEKNFQIVANYDTLFSGNIFTLSANYDDDKCESVDFCDCCSYELIFLNQNKFVQVSPCGNIDYYTGGTYSYDDGLLELNFKNSLFPDECRSGPMPADQKEIVVKFMKRISEVAYYRIDTCKNLVTLNSSSLKYNERGLISNQVSDKKMDYLNWKILRVLDME